MSQLYLQGINEYMNRKDFNNKRFYQDVKQLFEQYGFIKKETDKTLQKA